MLPRRSTRWRTAARRSLRQVTQRMTGERRTGPPRLLCGRGSVTVRELGGGRRGAGSSAGGGGDRRWERTRGARSDRRGARSAPGRVRAAPGELRQRLLDGLTDKLIAGERPRNRNGRFEPKRVRESHGRSRARDDSARSRPHAAPPEPGRCRLHALIPRIRLNDVASWPRAPAGPWR